MLSKAAETTPVTVPARTRSAAVPAIAGVLAPFAGIAWPWYVLIGTTITVATGVASSFTHHAPGKNAGAAANGRPRVQPNE